MVIRPLTQILNRLVDYYLGCALQEAARLASLDGVFPCRRAIVERGRGGHLLGKSRQLALRLKIAR